MDTSHSKIEEGQQGGIRQATMARDIGLLTPLSTVMRWPDYTFGEHLVYGFLSADYCGWSRGFPRREVTPSEKMAPPFKGAAKYNVDLLLSMHPGKDEDYLEEEYGGCWERL